MDVRSYLKLITASILGALLLVSIFSPAIYNVGPFDIRARTQVYHQGLTKVELSPFGSISANTHNMPVKIAITLEQIDFDQLTTLLEFDEDDSEELLQKWEHKFMKTLRAFIVKLLLLAGAGGFLGALVAGYRNKKELFLGLVIGIIFLFLLLGLTAYTYDYMAFMNPEFEGAVESFPWIMDIVEESLEKIGELGRQLEVISTNLYTLFQQIDEFGTVGGGIEAAYRVLHVSDIHNNPAAYDFIFQISESFEADLIIDTGDITDYGTPIEAELSSRIGELDIPYIFIPGNHDSPVVSDIMEEIPGVYVLREGVLEVFGLQVAGIEDPSSISREMEVKDESVLEEYSSRLKTAIKESGVEPDILGVHHPRIASDFFCDVPIVLTGHTHQPEVEMKEGSVFINAGTTGAAGIRGLNVDEIVPYSLALLHIDEEKELMAADLIEITNLEGGYRIERLIPEYEKVIHR